MRKINFLAFIFVSLISLVYSQRIEAVVPNPPETLPAAPVHAAGDVLSIYSGYYDNATAISSLSGVGVVKEFRNVLDDEMIYFETGLSGWSVVSLSSPVNIASHNVLFLDIYVVSGNFNMKVRLYDGSSTFNIPVVEGWNRLQLDLTDYLMLALPPDLTQVSSIAFVNDGGYARTVYIDNIYACNAVHPEQLVMPALPAAAPTHASKYVLPIFSDAYSTNVGFTVDALTPGSPKKYKGKYYSPSTDLEKMYWINAGMNNGNGGFLFSSIQNVSAYDYLHVDLFLAGTNTLPLRFRFGVNTTTFTTSYAPNPTATVFTAQPGWNSINIKLSDFLALAANTFDLTTMNGIGFWHKTGGTRTVYIDNIYFYKVPTQYRAKASGLWSDFNIWQKWNGTAWADAVAGQIPNSASTITIDNAEVTIDAPVTVDNLTIGSEGMLTLPEGKTLEVTGDFNINADAGNNTGTFVDENSNGGLTISGQVNVQQYLQGGRNWYISSPVKDASADIITSGKTGNALFKYDEVNNAWPLVSTFESAKGYVAAIAPANGGTYTFTGTEINQGPQSVSINRTALATKAGFNLVGNPYPAYYNIRTTLNETAGLDKTVWYRVRNFGNTAYFFDTFNAVSNLGTNNNGRGNVSGILPPFQSVWVRVSQDVESVAIEYSNSQTSHKNITGNPLRSPGVDEQRVLRLSVSNTVYEDEAIVYFNNRAENYFDSYDSPKMSNNSLSIPEIQTKAENEYLAINGLNESALFNEIPLYFKTAKPGTFTLRVKEMTNFENLSLILTDKETNTEKILHPGEGYSFESGTSGISERLVLNVKSITTDVINSAVALPVELSVTSGGTLLVSCDNTQAGNVDLYIYNTTGQLVHKTSLTGKQTIVEHLQSGIYIVRIQSNNSDYTKNIVIF